MKLTITTLLCLVFLSTANLFADLPPCLSEDIWPESPWYEAAHPYTVTIGKPYCVLTIHYSYRVHDGEYEIYVENVEKTGNCEFLDSIANKDGYQSAFREWVSLLLIQEANNLESSQFVPLCEVGTVKKMSVYTSTCGLWVKCTFQVDPATRVCEADWRGAYPEYGEGETKYIDYWRYVSCGQSCCKETYEICLYSLDSTGANTYVKILSRTKEQIGECSGQSEFVKPCVSGCN